VAAHVVKLVGPEGAFKTPILGKGRSYGVSYGTIRMSAYGESNGHMPDDVM